TKLTLQQVAQGTTPLDRLGGNSNAMAIRSASALSTYATEDEVAIASRLMMFTHANEEALAGGEFFTRVAWKVAHSDMTPGEAMDAVALTSGPWIRAQVRKGVDKFLEATDPSAPLHHEEYVDDLAMTSMARLWDVGKTEPIILKYANSYEDAVKANAMVGGDNASRAIAIGMVLGAYHGVEDIPPELLVGLNAFEKCDKLLRELPVVKSLLDKEL
ncbi:ADP-ribosylglycohydrolase family protein, partial [bacterium]|nr:ADP-ribosylglycohydrolase family protein [bacterium]